MINDMNTPLDPFVYNNSYYPTDLAASQYYYQSGGSSGNAEQIQQIIMMYSELKGVAPEEIVEGLKSLSEEEASQQLQLMLEEIEDAEYQQQIEQSRKASEEQDVDYDAEEEVGMPYGYDPEEFIERQEMILQNQQQEANDRIAEEEEAEPEPTEAQSYLTDPYKYGGAKKRFISKLKKAMGGMDVVKMPQADFNKNNYGENMLGSFVQGVQNNSKKALINEAAQNVEKTISQNPEMLLAPMAQFGMQMYNPMSTLSANAGAGMDYINSRMPSNQAMMDSFGNAYNQFLNDTGIDQAANDQQQTLRYGGGLKRFQNNGEVNVKDMLDDEPIIVTDPNDPRLEEYKLRQKLYEGNIYPPEGVHIFNYKDYNLPAYNIFGIKGENLKVSKTLDKDRFDRLDPRIRSEYKTHPSIYPDRFYEVISTDDNSWVDYDKKTGLEKFNKDDIKRFRLTPEFAKKVYETQPYIYSFKGRTYCDNCDQIAGYNDFSVPLYDKPKPVIYDNIGSISKEWGRNWKSTSGRNAPPRPGMSASNAGTMSDADNFGNYYQVRYKDGNSKIFTPDEFEEYKLSQEYLDHKKVENYLQQQQERKKEERRARVEAAKTPLVNKRYGGDLPKAQDGEDLFPGEGMYYQIPEYTFEYKRGFSDLPTPRYTGPLMSQQLIDEATQREYEQRRRAIDESIAAARNPLSAEMLAKQSATTGDKLSLQMMFGDPYNSPRVYEALGALDFINPGVMLGDMATGLGALPYNIQEGNYGSAALGLVAPLATGALASIGVKSPRGFINNLVNPFAGIGDTPRQLPGSPNSLRASGSSLQREQLTVGQWHRRPDGSLIYIVREPQTINYPKVKNRFSNITLPKFTLPEFTLPKISVPKISVPKIPDDVKFKYQLGHYSPRYMYRNAQKYFPDDSMSHALFGDAKTGTRVALQASDLIPKGRRFGDKDLSSDSFSLLLGQLARKVRSKEFKVFHTGAFNKLNSFGKNPLSQAAFITNNIDKKKELVDYLNKKINAFNKNTNSKIPNAKIINNNVYIPHIVAEKKGASLLDKYKRDKKLIDKASILGGAGAIGTSAIILGQDDSNIKLRTEDDSEDIKLNTAPSRVYPYRQGGSLPKAVNGKEYIRKLWEQQYSGDITDEEKEKLFDDFYNTYSNIFSQSNFQSAGNMFNNVPGLGQNPWGYRSFNNPFLQQYAYNPRWYAQKPGSNKKINIRNLPDWSDANLIKTEQMTNRRGRPTGYRYTLQKPSSVIRTEQPAADPNYVVPKVPDVMLNPATQSSVVTSTNPSNISTSTNSTDSKKTAISNAVAKFKQDISDEIRSLQEQFGKPRKKLNQKSKPGIVNIKPDQSTNTNSTDDLEISNEKRKKFDQTIENAPEGNTIEIVKPKQYGGPSLVPYSNEYMAQQYADYKNFYDDYTRPPSNRTMGDGYDAYDRYMRRNIKKNPIYASGWLKESKDGTRKIFYDEADNSEPQPSSKYNVRRVDNYMIGFQDDPIESKMIGDMSTAMAWQNAADRRKNRFPQNMYPGFLKSQQKGGQLYLYRNGGLPKFQGPEASELTALKPRTYPDPFKAGVTESNMEYPEETLDVVQTTKPNFLQGVVRAMPYMNFANNMYDRISAENQRNKLRQQATSIEGIVSPISDYKGRFSEYGAYQPNLQGFQGMGSARFGGNITDGEYYLSDSEIQDIINMGGEVEFLED